MLPALDHHKHRTAETSLGHSERGLSLPCECGDHVFANLTKGHVVLVSPQDAAHLARKWHVNVHKDGYVAVVRGETVAPRTTRTTVLAREILRLAPGTFADHVNGSTVDNRRPNIRPSSPSQNSRNRKLGSNSTIGLKGVYRKGKSFCAYIRANGKPIHLGSYATAEAAHSAYAAAAERLFGEFARVK